MRRILVDSVKIINHEQFDMLSQQALDEVMASIPQ